MSLSSRAREISDEIVSFDPGTRVRAPVSKAVVLQRFREIGDYRAARVVEGIPTTPEGTLLPEAVDHLLIRAHCEMQRISEEFEHGARVAILLRALLDALRKQHAGQSYRIVDIGCGTGYVIRWLAAYGDLGPDVELLGVDFNPALVAEARRLTALESLQCSFEVADAFALEKPGAVYLSTGVLHHFRGDASLAAFFGQHEQPEAHAFLHFDFQPSFYAAPGSWLFHVLRVREPLARHDGVVSALRVHNGDSLLRAARAGAPGFVSGVYGARLFGTPIRRVFHTLVGVRPALVGDFRAALGPRARALEMVV